VHLIAQGTVGYMVALQQGQLTAISIDAMVAQPKRVPLNSDLLRASEYFSAARSA
jgi:hypothetical protein